MSARPLTPEDLRWLACSVCHQTLELQLESVCCTACGRRYPIVDGIAVLLAERVL